MMRGFEKMCNAAIPGSGRGIVGDWPDSCWVAEITGKDDRFGFKREFLRFKKDYSEANSKGSRGVMAVYTLNDFSFYEVKDNKKRYFCKLEDWNIVQIEKEEIDSWLKDISESMS